jgi:hypothetical protein
LDDAEQVVLLNAGSTHDEAHEAEIARLMAHQ